jgi:hypothetical protein
MQPLRSFLLSVGLSLCLTLCVVALSSPAGAQEATTTTTESTTTTTEAPTTTSTTAPPAPDPEEPTTDSDDELGSREALQWLAFLASFYIGHGLTR